MLVFLVSLVSCCMTVMFQLSGFYSSRGAFPKGPCTLHLKVYFFYDICKLSGNLKVSAPKPTISDILASSFGVCSRKSTSKA